MPTGSFMAPLGRTPLSALSSRRLNNVPVHNDEIMITPLSYCSIAHELAAFGDANYSSNTPPIGSSKIWLTPFQIAKPFLIRKVFWLNGVTATTNSADAGVYDDNFNLVVAGGGTTISGQYALQEVDVTDTLIKPGRYYLAYTQNGTTASPICQFTIQTTGMSAMGCLQASGYPLSSSVTPGAITDDLIPISGISSRTLTA